MKRILTAALIIIFTFTFFIPVSGYAAEIMFADVKTDDWYYKNLQELIQKDIVGGYPDGTFKPDSTLKFEEFIKMLVVAVEGKTIEAESGQQWYENYIEFSKEHKYINEEQKSLIGQNIKRGTMAEILYNMLSEKENIKEYTDVELEFLSDRLTDINKTDVKTLTINGIGVISGYPDGTFKPDNSLKRSESIAVISRIINKQLRNPVTIELPDTRTLEELPEVDLSHLYDYPTLLGDTVDSENQNNRKKINVSNFTEDAVRYVELMHNRDYKTIEKERGQFEKEIIYLLNAYKEYKGVIYDEGLKAYFTDFDENDSQVYRAYVLSLDTYIENFIDVWVQDTINNKVQVQAQFYTNEDLVILADGSRAARGILRIKYDNHNNPANIKYELDLVDSETQKRGKRILNLGQNAYNIYLNYNEIKEFKVGKWYEIDMDMVMPRGGIAKGLEVTDTYMYEYIYPIAVREVK